MIAAKEFQDVNLFVKLRNSVDRNIYRKKEAYHYIYRNINNPIYNGALLWTKVHLGWQTILDYDWGYNNKFKIPDVQNIEWTDILDQKILLIK
jgi:hypothetical protein